MQPRCCSSSSPPYLTAWTATWRACSTVPRLYLCSCLRLSDAPRPTATSQFGAELDSLCDLVDFGVAPALVTYAWCGAVTPLVCVCVCVCVSCSAS
jgi:hypothetical protein